MCDGRGWGWGRDERGVEERKERKKERRGKKKVLSTTIIPLEGATSRLGFEAIYTDDSGNTAQIEFNSKLIHPHYFLIKK